MIRRIQVSSAQAYQKKMIGFMTIIAFVVAIIGVVCIANNASGLFYELELTSVAFLLGAFAIYCHKRSLQKRGVLPPPLPSLSLSSGLTIKPLPLMQIDLPRRVSETAAPALLSLSDHFFDDTDYFSAGWKVVYNKTTFHLDIKPPSEISAHEETDLSAIARSVNALTKPLFHQIEQYRNLCRKLRIMNAMSSNDTIRLESFHEKLSPDSSTLLDKIWAVHATFQLPGATLDPFIREFRAGLCQKPLSGFSPTVHFTLGELVRPHSKHYTWEDHSFALITPLRTIFAQIINIFVHDTFILGRWTISPMAVLIVPEGTEVPASCYQISTYNPQKMSLREAVASEISKRNGLRIRMLNLQVYAGSPAYIEGDININTPLFFDKLIQDSGRAISFGDHCHSMVGRASIFGYLRWYDPIIRFTQLNAPSKKMLYPILYYFYEQIKDVLSKQQLLEVHRYLHKIQEIQSTASPLPATFYLGSEIFQFMPREELLSFQQRFPQLFCEGYNRYEFEALWAMGRWIIIGDQRADMERLPEIVDVALERLLLKPNGFVAIDVFKTMISCHLEGQSITLEIVLRILQKAKVHQYLDLLVQHGHPVFHRRADGRYHFETLDHTLRSHVDTARYFGGETAQQTIHRMSSRDFRSTEILLQMRPIPIERDDYVTRQSYEHIKELLDFRDYAEQSIRDLYKPIDAPDNRLMRYYQIEGYRSAKGLWRRLKLEKEFTKLFPNEDDFWRSRASFWEVYTRCKG